jgi:hypothetical protein
MPVAGCAPACPACSFKKEMKRKKIPEEEYAELRECPSAGFLWAVGMWLCCTHA